jgi:hypothetical protein
MVKPIDLNATKHGRSWMCLAACMPSGQAGWSRSELNWLHVRSLVACMDIEVTAGQALDKLSN